MEGVFVPQMSTNLSGVSLAGFHIPAIVIWIGFIVMMIIVGIISAILWWHWRQYSLSKKQQFASQTLYFSVLIALVVSLVVLIISYSSV